MVDVTGRRDAAGQKDRRTRMDPYTATRLAQAMMDERLREAARDRRSREASDYAVTAATSLPPRGARGDWRLMLSRIVGRRLQAGLRQ
jgi:hypothetical protein